MKKIASAVKKENGEVTPAKFEIRFSTLGSIDDAFAAYVAGFENVSISNTSNYIKNYCQKAKNEVYTNGKFTFEHLGYLTLQNNQIIFVQTDELEMGNAALPLPEIDHRLKSNTEKKFDFSYPVARTSPIKVRKIGISKILVPLILVLFLMTVAFFAYRYIASNNELVKDTQELNNTSDIITPPTQDSLTNNNLQQSAITDSNNQTNSIAPVPNAEGIYKIALFHFNNEAQANAKSGKLNSFGNRTEVVNLNESFIVAILSTNPQNDTTKLVDSLRKFFNPKGNVFVIH
ncbi:MAG TPA: hypothetical protein PKA54_03300 [Chitinophagaceae bacterium]|nr:hypothetical protein [Chitinophagaceae bacterium]